MFTSNNLGSLHLRWKKSFVKQQKVSKCYTIDCSIFTIRSLSLKAWEVFDWLVRRASSTSLMPAGIFPHYPVSSFWALRSSIWKERISSKQTINCLQVILPNSRNNENLWKHGCVKSVRIRSYSGPHFPASGLNTENVSLHIQSECGETEDQNSSESDTFYAKHSMILTSFNISFYHSRTCS